jgi:hypothetical protein
MRSPSNKDDSELDQDNIDDLIADEKIKIDLKKKISKELSKEIMCRINKYRNKNKVEWKKVIQCFCCEDSVENMEKKLRNHYYNQRVVMLKKKKKVIKLLYIKWIKFLSFRFRN